MISVPAAKSNNRTEPPNAGIKLSAISEAGTSQSARLKLFAK